jgi:hypothetical protein
MEKGDRDQPAASGNSILGLCCAGPCRISDRLYRAVSVLLWRSVMAFAVQMRLLIRFRADRLTERATARSIRWPGSAIAFDVG